MYNFLPLQFKKVTLLLILDLFNISTFLLSSWQHCIRFLLKDGHTAREKNFTSRFVGLVFVNIFSQPNC